MNQKLKYGLFLLLFGGAAIVVFWPESSESKAPREQGSSIRESQKHDSSVERMKELIINDYNTPIDFWGKVIDGDGNPLADVRAEITVDEHAANKKYVTFSDDEGMFELLGKKGARARIKVFRDGYAPTSDEIIGSRISARTIYYAPKSKPMPAYAPPTKDNPQTFVLRKKNPVANLAHVTKKRIYIDKAGATQKALLKTEGKAIGLEVRCWSSCPVPFTYDRYDWRAEIEIVGGKLQAITEIEPVTAPTKGYQQVFKINMPKHADKTWKAANVRQKDFWVQFDDGTYAKARIEVNTGRKHYINTEIWYNLDGTNNFEQ